MKELGRGDFSSNEWIWFNLLGLAGGIAVIWIYAAIRPRFGAGMSTAVRAGLASWLSASLLPNFSFMWVAGLFSQHLLR